MTENKQNSINPIISALDSIDENIAAAAAPKRGIKKPLGIAVVAAAAVLSLGLLVGFANSSGDGKNRVEFGSPLGVWSRGFYLDLKEHEVTIPEEYYQLMDEYGNCYAWAKEAPSEVIRSFGLEPLTNANFSDVIDESMGQDVDQYGVMHYYWQPFVQISYNNVQFTYYLYDKNIDETIKISALYVTDTDTYSSSHGVGLLEDEEFDVIKLNDGSECFISEFEAIFSYNGVKYELDITGERRLGQGLERVKQVLVDFEVL